MGTPPCCSIRATSRTDSRGITGSSAILITHQHPDHVDLQRLPALVEANPGAALYADPMTAAQLGGPWQAVHAGDNFTVADLTVRGSAGSTR